MPETPGEAARAVSAPLERENAELRAQHRETAHLNAWQGGEIRRLRGLLHEAGIADPDGGAFGAANPLDTEPLAALEERHVHEMAEVAGAVTAEHFRDAIGSAVKAATFPGLAVAEAEARADEREKLQGTLAELVHDLGEARAEIARLRELLNEASIADSGGT